jgi:hypothetical protein
LIMQNLRYGLMNAGVAAYWITMLPAVVCTETRLPPPFTG